MPLIINAAVCSIRYDKTLLVNVTFLFSLLIASKHGSFNSVCINACNQTIVMKIHDKIEMECATDKTKMACAPSSV